MADIYRRDSISKSEPYDLYAVIRNHNSPPPPIKKTLDTLEVHETELERLEKEALAKFRANNFRLPNETLVVIGRAGKILFFAATLPPYLFLYLLPKWVLIEFLPQFFDFSKKPFILTWKLFKDIGNFAVIQLQSGKSEFLAKLGKGIEYIKWINATIASVFVHLKHQIIHLSYQFLNPFTVVRERIKENIHKYMQPIKEACKNYILRTSEKGKQKFKEIKEAIQKRVEIVQKTTQQIIQPIIIWALPKIEWANSYIEKSFEKIHKTSNRVQNKIIQIRKQIENKLKPYLDRCVRTIGKTKEWIRKTVYDAAKPVIEKLSPYIAKMQHGIRRGVARAEKIRTEILKKSEAVKEKAKQAAIATSQAIANTGTTILFFAHQIFEYALPENFKKWIKQKKDAKHKEKGKSKSTIKALKTLVGGISDRINAKIYKMSHKSWTLLAIFFAWLLAQITAAPAILRRKAIQSFYAILRAAKHLVYLSKVTFAWLRVLLRYGMERVRERCMQIIESFLG